MVSQDRIEWCIAACEGIPDGQLQKETLAEIFGPRCTHIGHKEEPSYTHDNWDGLSHIYCGKIAVWRGEWSDREGQVCEEHREGLRKAHDNDHSYDATGIYWTYLKPGTPPQYERYERRPGLPLKDV